MSINNILPHEFHTLSQQNTRLNQNLINITLNHENLLEENRQLSEELKKKDYALIESTLRERNLDHTLKNVQGEYSKLQEQYEEVYNMVKASKRLEVREIYKKESQLAFDMANIERESYRETKKAKNEQINQYQERIINLAKQNDSLKVKMLQMTSEYNTKLYELKSANIQNQAKLNALKSLQTKKNSQNVLTSKNDLEILQLQLKLQNLNERLEFYIKQNREIKQRNIQLNGEVDRLLGELKEVEENGETKEEEVTGELWKVLNKEGSSVEYITRVIQENSKLRKEIEEVTQKYVLLTETYPKLIEEFQTINQLQQNLQKLNQVKSLQHKLYQSQTQLSSLQTSLKQLQSKYSQQLKSRQSLEYKSSILTKRFNEIFINMNPYFDIYQYEILELDEGMWQFFDERKDYKQLKEYEGKVLGLKREIKEWQAKYEGKERELKMKVEEKEREVAKISGEKEQLINKVNELSDSNKLLKQQLANYQLSINKIQLQPNQQNPTQSTTQKKLQHQITLPLLQQMITNLHLQREQLFKAIYSKDKRIAELCQQLHSSKLNLQIKTVKLTTSQPQDKVIEFGGVSGQFTQLLRHNQELERKYDENVERLEKQLKKLKDQLNNQHNLYQLQVKKYQNEYEAKFIEMKKILDKWIASSEELRVKLQLNEQQKISEQDKKNNQMDQQEKRRQPHHQEGAMAQQNPAPINPSQQPHHQPNPLIRHPSHTNLQKLSIIHNNQNQQQSSNKLIGQSTVQTLTQTLKKYQQDMNEVLGMCAKVSKDYSELKEKVRNQEELERKNWELTKECVGLREELEKTKQYLNEKNLAINTLETLYKTKSTYCQQLQSQAKHSHSILQNKLTQQQTLTQQLTKQLQDLKEKFYQLAAKPSSVQDTSVMNRGEFETIVIMQANKNKEIANLAEKNKHLESKMYGLMQELNQMKVKEVEKKAQEISPMERAEMKQLAELLQGTNVIDLVKRANQIIEAQVEKEKLIEKERKEQQAIGKPEMEEKPEKGEHVEGA